jgi:hypothetical protein
MRVLLLKPLSAIPAQFHFSGFTLLGLLKISNIRRPSEACPGRQ